MSKGILDVVHSDVWGPAQVATLGGCRYYVTFIDDFSRHTWIYPMRQKRSVRTLPTIQSRNRKDHGSARTLPSIKWRQ